MKAPAVHLKHFIGASILCLALYLAPSPSQALTVEQVPNSRQIYGGWVTDMADILQPETEAQLNQMINQLEANNGAEVAVVTVPETAPATSPKAFTTKLFNYWHIGKKGQNNGVLFLISKSDRRVEIETGYGVERILPNATVGNIIDTQILPRFKQGDFDGGTLAGSKTIVTVLTSHSTKNVNTQILPSFKQGDVDDGTLAGSKTIVPVPISSPTNSVNLISSNRDEKSSGLYLNNLWYLLATSGAIGAGILIYLKFHKIFLHPRAFSLMRFSWLTPRIYCAECGSQMKQLEPSAISELSNMNLDLMKDTKFQLWQCPHCAHKFTTKPFHIRMQSSPTPKLTAHRANHRTKNGSGNWYIGVGSDFSSGYSGSGGGCDFGGGESGGGGAGGNW